jgi:DNA-binding protein H-NS
MHRKIDLEAMPLDEMWALHEEIGQILSVRLTSEKRELEKRLAQLRGEKETALGEHPEGAPRERRKYPRVYPKYRNPNEPSETWSGRGKQPRWLTAALRTGRSIDEFVIANQESGEGASRRRRA